MKSKSVNIGSSQLAFKINLYILRELVEVGPIRDEYRVIAVPNKKNKYLLVIPNEDANILSNLSKAINLIKLGWLGDLVISFNMLVLILMVIGILI